MDFLGLSPTAQIVSIMRRTYKKGLISSRVGSMSLRDKSGNIWITPLGVDNGRLAESDIIMRDRENNVYGKHPLPPDAGVHFEIYSRRRDIGGIIYADPQRINGLASRGVIPDTMIFPQCEMRCGTVKRIEYAGEHTEADTDFISVCGDAFDDGISTLICGTGGLIIGEGNLLESFMALETIDLVSSVWINSMILGKMPQRISPCHLAQYKLSVSLPLMEELNREELPNEKEVRQIMCGFIDRAYETDLFLDGNGALSVKLGNDAFLITPSDKERAGIKPEELVLIHRGRKEAGKNPSNSAALHRRIYSDNPFVKSIMISHPRNAMAFGAVSAVPDSSCYPKWKEAAGNISLLPFGSTVMQPGMFSAGITKNDMAYIVENDCVICMGVSIEDAFTRSEAIEKCAAADISGKLFG